VIYRGQNTPLAALTAAELLPSTDGYMTYEGSWTQPGCQEGVTWILMNRPIYATAAELAAMRRMRQGERASPKSPLGAPNSRPAQEANGRTVRTNVVVEPEVDEEEDGGRKRPKCPDVAGEMVYRPNTGWED